MVSTLLFVPVLSLQFVDLHYVLFPFHPALNSTVSLFPDKVNQRVA